MYSFKNDYSEGAHRQYWKGCWKPIWSNRRVTV